MWIPLFDTTSLNLSETPPAKYKSTRNRPAALISVKSLSSEFQGFSHGRKFDIEKILHITHSQSIAILLLPGTLSLPLILLIRGNFHDVLEIN